jgi:hypothetical protein
MALAYAVRDRRMDDHFATVEAIVEADWTATAVVYRSADYAPGLNIDRRSARRSIDEKRSHSSRQTNGN